MSKAKKTRRRRKPTAQPGRMETLAGDILSETIAGLITAAILRLLKWYGPGVRGPVIPVPQL